MRNRKVLFLSADTFPPAYAFLDHVWNRILPEAGYQCSWIMPSGEVRQTSETSWDNSRVWLVPKVRATGFIDLVTAYTRHLRFVQEAVERALARIGSVDIMQVRDDPIMAYAAWRLSRRDRIPFVYQISHLKEEENILYARMRMYGNPFKNYFQGKVGLLLRNWLLQKADLVFPISNRMRLTLASYGIKWERMVVLPEGVDTLTPPTRFDDTATNMRCELGLEGKKLLGYVGTMNRFRQLDFLLCVLRQVLDVHSNVHLLMVGGGRDPGDLPWLQNAANQEGVREHITFTGEVSRSQVSAYIRASDIGLSPIPTNPVYINSSPIKVLEYLALEVPCVASDVPDQCQIITDSGGGLCVSYEEASFVGAISSLLELSGDQLKKMGEKGRTYVAIHRDFTVLADQVVECYSKYLRV